MTRTPAQLATHLVDAFGHPDEMVAVLDNDATWWITPSVPPEIMQSATTGREAIGSSMQRVFTTLYNGETLKATVHSAISDGNLGTIRFELSGEFANGGKYSNEYCVCVETRHGLVAKVWEYVDGAYAMLQMQEAGIDVTPGGGS